MSDETRDDMNRRLRAIAKADREARIVDWIVWAVLAGAIAWAVWPR